VPPQGAKRESTGRSPTAWFVLAGGFVLAILAWRGAAERLEERRRLVFDHQVEAVSDGILQRVRLYETIARAAAAFFQRSGSMTRAEWAAFVDQMDLDPRHPGIQALEVALRIPAAGLQGHIDAVRAEGFPDYDVHPPGPRAEYFPIVYLEPWEHNHAAFGYDVLAEARRRAAAERARDTGEVSITEPIQLVQDADAPARPAYLMFVPIYRGIGASPTPDDRRVRLAGFITGGFHVADLVAGVSPDRRPGVGFALYDGPVETSSAPLYADAPVATGASALRRDVRLDVGGRAWTLRFGARPWLDP